MTKVLVVIRNACLDDDFLLLVLTVADVVYELWESVCFGMELGVLRHKPSPAASCPVQSKLQSVVVVKDKKQET